MILIVANLSFERWLRSVEASLEDAAALAARTAGQRGLYLLLGMAAMTAGIVFVMVTKASAFG